MVSKCRAFLLSCLKWTCQIRSSDILVFQVQDPARPSSAGRSLSSLGGRWFIDGKYFNYWHVDCYPQFIEVSLTAKIVWNQYNIRPACTYIYIYTYMYIYDPKKIEKEIDKWSVLTAFLDDKTMEGHCRLQTDQQKDWIFVFLTIPSHHHTSNNERASSFNL